MKPETVVGTKEWNCTSKAHMDGGNSGVISIFFDNLSPEIQALIEEGEKERDLTPEEALEEARKRWGGDGQIYIEGDHTSLRFIVAEFTKQAHGNGGKLGIGPSFREAFANADKGEPT